MPYIVDGHNLIPSIPGLSLRGMEDEMQLVRILQNFSRVSRKKVEVYFDNPEGLTITRKMYGTVTVVFTRRGVKADHAISERLRRLKRGAKNWTVVSDDREVKAEARNRQAGVLSVNEFVRMLLKIDEQGAKSSRANVHLSADEVDEWLSLFSNGDGDEVAE